MSSRIINALLALSLEVAVAGGLGFSGQQSEVRRSPEQRAAGDAAWRGGLKKQAQVAGGHYSKLPDWEGEVQYDCLIDLARDAGCRSWRHSRERMPPE
jgi:hypothetical protein